LTACRVVFERRAPHIAMKYCVCTAAICIVPLERLFSRKASAVI